MHHWSRISLYQYCCDLVDIDWVIGNPSRLLVNGLIWYWMYWCCYCCCCVIFHRCNDIHRWFVVVVDIRLRVTTTSLSLLSDTTMNDGERGWGRGHMSMPSNHPILTCDVFSKSCCSFFGGGSALLCCCWYWHIVIFVPQPPRSLAWGKEVTAHIAAGNHANTRHQPLHR